MLFHVVNDRHRKKRAMIFTTNKPLTGVVHDEDLAHAVVDRMLERGRMLTLDGPSMWTPHLGLDDPTANPASIQAPASLGKAPEFPESSGQNLRNPHLRVHPPPECTLRCGSPQMWTNVHSGRSGS